MSKRGTRKQRLAATDRAGVRVAQGTIYLNGEPMGDVRDFSVDHATEALDARDALRESQVALASRTTYEGTATLNRDETRRFLRALAGFTTSNIQAIAREAVPSVLYVYVHSPEPGFVAVVLWLSDYREQSATCERVLDALTEIRPAATRLLVEGGRMKLRSVEVPPFDAPTLSYRHDLACSHCGESFDVTPWFCPIVNARRANDRDALRVYADCIRDRFEPACRAARAILLSDVDFLAHAHADPVLPALTRAFRAAVDNGFDD
jgi:hypothetical protein